MRKRGNIVDPEAELQLLNSTYENKVIKGLNIYLYKTSSGAISVCMMHKLQKNKFENIYIQAKDGSKVIEDLDKPQENNSPVKNVKQVNYEQNKE